MNFASAVLGLHTVSFFPSFFGVPKTTLRFVICWKDLELRKPLMLLVRGVKSGRKQAHTSRRLPSVELDVQTLYSPSYSV